MSSFNVQREGGFDQRSGPATPAADAPSVISQNLVVVGNIRSSGDVQIDGVLQGDVACRRLVLSANGVVEGKISAAEVVIHGSASGSIIGRSVMLHKTAQVGCDIKHQGIGIEMGTRYEGRLTWAEDRELEAAAAQAVGPEGDPNANPANPPLPTGAP